MGITLVNAADPAQRFVLNRLPATIGRQPKAAIRLDDRGVSYFQCRIDADGGRLTVLDLGSVSGTFVNGIRRALAPLLPGDRLTVGATDFLVGMA